MTSKVKCENRIATRPLGASIPLQVGTAALVVGSLICAMSSVALGAGSTYGGNVAPPAAAAGGFTHVVMSKTITHKGGTLRATAYGSTITLSIRSGTFATPGQVVLTANQPKLLRAGKGKTVVADFSVSVLSPVTGIKEKGPFFPAIVMNLRNSAIKVGDHVVIVVSKGSSRGVAAAKVANGLVTVSFSSDPNFAVVRG